MAFSLKESKSSRLGMPRTHHLGQHCPGGTYSQPQVEFLFPRYIEEKNIIFNKGFIRHTQNTAVSTCNKHSAMNHCEFLLICLVSLMFRAQPRVNQLHVITQRPPHQTVQLLGEVDWVEIQKLQCRQLLVIGTEGQGNSGMAFMHKSPVCNTGCNNSYRMLAPWDGRELETWAKLLTR